MAYPARRRPQRPRLRLGDPHQGHGLRPAEGEGGAPVGECGGNASQLNRYRGWLRIPGQWARTGRADTLAQNAAGEPGWLAALDRGAASAAGSHGLAASVLLAAVFAVIAAGILVPATTRPVLALAIVVGLAIWIVGENLGGMLTGMATDPNTGPILILLAAAYWPSRSRAPHRDFEPLAPVTVSRVNSQLSRQQGEDEPARCRADTIGE